VAAEFKSDDGRVCSSGALSTGGDDNDEDEARFDAGGSV
jgi:hypothetical protein